MPVGEHLRNWLFKVVRNKALDILRKEKRRALLHKKAAEEIDTTDIIDNIDTNENPDESKLRALADALPKLNPARREVLLLRLQQKLPHEQIAKITGHSPGHCRKLLHEAVAQLKQLVRIES